MALDLWIYGPGYGETTVLVWDEADGSKKAAIVDNYGGNSAKGQPALLCLGQKQYGNPPLAFVAATHPHLDHVRNFHVVLENCGAKLRTCSGGEDSKQATLASACTRWPTARS